MEPGSIYVSGFRFNGRTHPTPMNAAKSGPVTDLDRDGDSIRKIVATDAAFRQLDGSALQDVPVKRRGHDATVCRYRLARR
jgi:hypothetical protein